jgi:hypothetical protein
MSEKEKAILTTFEKVIPKMSDIEKERLLAFGEGMAFKTELQEKEKNAS